MGTEQWAQLNMSFRVILFTAIRMKEIQSVGERGP